MPIKLANNASGTLATAINASDTGIVLTTGDGAEFPTLGAGDYFYATITSAQGTQEIVKATARSGDSLTVVRAQEGTSAAGFAVGSRFELRVTAQSVFDAVGDVVASQVGFTPTGGVAATDVQAAIAELDTEKVAFTRLDDNDGSSLVGFLQSGTGAVQRSMQSKARDTVSVKDFGAVGNGVTDDTAAFAAALASGAMRVYVPYTGNEYIITSALSVPRGVILYGDTLDQPGILCKTATAGDIVFFTVTGNTQLENLRVYGDSATSGTLVSLTGGTYTFTGNIRMRNVRLYQAKVGLFVNSIFNARISGCEFRGCKRGVDASPLTNGGDNGYINTLSFSDCYWGANTDYDVYANPAVRISVISFASCTFDPGPTVAKVYLKAANPCSFKDCYFEGGSTVPAIQGSLSTITTETSYFTGTKGVEYDATQAILVMRQCRTASTDIVNAGNASHTLRILDTTLPGSGNVFPSASVKYFDNATINGTVFNFARNQSAVFTPTLTGTGGTSGNTYVWQTGFYTRNGNVVHFHGVVRISALDAGITGTVRVNLVGLPTSQNTTLNNAICSVGLQSVVLSASRNRAFGRIDLNTNVIDIYEEGSNVSASLMPVGNLTATSIIWFSGHYLLSSGV